MNKFLYNLKESRIFQFVVISIIILNAITIGVNTYDLNELTKLAINYLDYSITIFFVIEIIIRFVGEPKKLQFFKSGWNVFDTLIVLILSLIHI